MLNSTQKQVGRHYVLVLYLEYNKVLVSEFSFDLNGNLRNDAHWKLGPVFLGGHPQGDFGKSPQGVQISNHMHSGKPRTITNLKKAIREEMRALPRSLCKDVMGCATINVRC